MDKNRLAYTTWDCKDHKLIDQLKQKGLDFRINGSRNRSLGSSGQACFRFTHAWRPSTESYALLWFAL